MGIDSFVNADVIVEGLSGFAPDAAFEAGRVMLMRARELPASRADFALECTLSGRTLHKFLTASRPWAMSAMFSTYGCHRRRWRSHV